MRRATVKAKNLVSKHPWRKALVVVAAFAVMGIVITLSARAANLAVTVEAEAGVLAGRASVGAGTGASGDSAVAFGQRNYVAFGDSVASGDGIEYGWKWTPNGAGDGSWARTGPATPIWEPAADTRPEVQACRRSTKGYPYLVAATTGDKFYNPSCSGTSILNGLLGARNFGSGVIGAAQLGSTQTLPGYAPPNANYDSFKPDVITITLGMDDVGFSDVLKQCYLGTSCVTAGNEQDMNARLTKFKAALSLGLAEIKDRGTTAGKVPWVVLTTYYDPFNPDSNKSCNDTYLGLGQGLSAEEITWMRSKMMLMNQYIKDAGATYPKIKIADITAALAGHTFCTADPWIYGISIWFSDFGNPAPFHPTAQGQAAIAEVIVPIIKSL
jgi:lysophospholipase L1-like esterase